MRASESEAATPQTRRRKLQKKTVTKDGFRAAIERVEPPIRLRCSANKRNSNCFYTENRTARPRAIQIHFRQAFVRDS
jgi:hypothetical protein